MDRIPTYAWRAALLGPVYAFSTASTAALVGVAGLGQGFVPGSPDPSAALAHLVVAGAIVGTALGLVSSHLALGGWRRWLLLTGLAGTLVLSSWVQAAVLSEGLTAGGIPGLVAGPLIGLGVTAVLAVLMFPPGGRVRPAWQLIGQAASRRGPGGWAWRIGLLALAYPAVNGVAGLILWGLPVLPYLDAAFYATRLPAPGLLASVEIARGLVLALVAWPVVLGLRASGRRPWGWLALLLVTVAGLLPWLQPGPTPWLARIAPMLAVVAASLVHAWILAKLLDPGDGPVRGSAARTRWP